MREVFNLADALLFDRLEEGRGDRWALRFGERRWTYAQVADRAARMAEVLDTAGMRCEERVLVVLPDLPAFVWTVFGVLRAGGVLATASPYTPAADLADLLDYTRASVLVTVPSVAEALDDVLCASPWLESVILTAEVDTDGDPDAPIPEALLEAEDDEPDRLWLTAALEEADGDHEAPPTYRDDAALWVFTSGSTGRPKAAVHTHGSVAVNVEAYAKRTIGWKPEDVCLNVPRLYFTYATASNLFFPFSVGAEAVLFSERPTAAAVARAVARYRPSVLTSLPTMMARLLDHDEALRGAGRHGADLSSLRMCISAGETLAPALLERWSARFGVPVYDGLGAGEMFHIYVTNRPGDVRPGSVGRPVEGYEIRILPRDAEHVGIPPLPPGEVGVLWVRGASIATGFWQDRAASLRTFHGPWCRTFDLAAQEADGHVRFLGRAGELIRVAGQWVSPAEVEDCLVRHPQVAEAAVIAIGREGLTVTKAFLVLRPGAGPLDPEEVRTFVKERLAAFKSPREIEIVDSLPKNDRGKMDRKILEASEASRAVP